jgi:hypothetical protein
MKKITLNGIGYNLPENWDEISIRMQLKVSDDTDKIEHEQLKKLAILSGYCDIPIEELKRANLKDVTRLFNNMKFLNDPLPDKPLVKFEYKGEEYMCGQNLIDMQFQDFISIENAISEHTGNTYNALPTIMAIMCKKKKKVDGSLESLDDYNVKERAELFLDLPVTIAHQLSLFFSISEGMLSKTIPLFSKVEVQKAVMQSQIERVESMLKELDGKGLLTRFAIGILRYCLRYIKRAWQRHFTSIA